MTSSPATSPNVSVTGSNMSPVCGSEGELRTSVSPPLPSRIPTVLDPSRIPGLHTSSNLESSPSFPGLPDPSSLAAQLSSYPRLPLHTSLAATTSMPGYPGLGGDQSYPSLSMENFYSPLANPYSIKDSGEPGGVGAAGWPGAQGMQGGLSYPAAYPYDTLSAYGYGGAYGLAATRKNVTRESTSTLKAWLNEHKKNPYPTKGEKIMLAIISKMTLTQVSCWFANARRRLKKENKMTWEPKNGLNDEDVDVSDEEEGDNSFNREDKPNALEHEDQRSSWVVEGSDLGSAGPVETKDGIPIPPTKPRIWSMAELAVSKSSYVGCG